MAITITQNRKNTSFVVHAASANGTIKVAGNNSVSDVALDGEVLTGATIVQAVWGVDPTDDGHVVVKRGDAVVAVYDSTGYHDYAGSTMPLSVNKEGDLVFEFNCSPNSFVMLELQKVGANSASDYFVN